MFDVGLLPARHEVWEVFGIGEEGEDQVDRIWKPLLCCEGMSHGLNFVAPSGERFLEAGLVCVDGCLKDSNLEPKCETQLCEAKGSGEIVDAVKKR